MCVYISPHAQAHLRAILGRVLHDLTAHGECLLTLDEANLLSLKLTAVMREPPTVRERHVSWGCGQEPIQPCLNLTY